MSEKASNNALEVVITNALRIPGVKVNRREFLIKTFDNHLSNLQIQDLIEKGPVLAGIKLSTIEREAKNLINKRTLQSSGASFAAGLPGGFAMAATIPADTLQFFGVVLRMAQELAYIYGFKDLWENGNLDDKNVIQELVVFIGVMFGVGGSATALRLISVNMSKQALKKIPQKALTNTIYYPIIKKIAAVLGVKLTKDTFAKGVSKAIPIIGGIISGGMTYASMKPMGERLRKVLDKSVTNYSQADYDRDVAEVASDITRDFVEVDYEVIEEDNIGR
ncbi:bacteriochlorophyll 4-vinyl reductase [Clostridium sp.]|uniref:bacteriochlorophyll 4-vinyl reductase n=1 Tax=Clostridium sp. TaxID=1506 RepID=UPI002FC79DF1